MVIKGSIKHVALILSSAALFYLVHFPQEFCLILKLLRFVANFALDYANVYAESFHAVYSDEIIIKITARIRKVVFSASSVVLLVYCLPELFKKNKMPSSFNWYLRGVVIFSVAGLFVFPSLVGGLGIDYCLHSDRAFMMERDWYYRRLWSLGIGALVGFEGLIMHAVYVWVLAVASMFMTLRVLECGGVRLPMLLSVSFLTISAFMTQYHQPGTIDPALVAGLLLFHYARIGPVAQLSLYSLLLATHELSMFVVLPWTLFVCRDRKLFCGIIAVSIVYVLAALLSYAGNVQQFVASSQVNHLPPWQLIDNQPLFLIVGVLAALKMVGVILLLDIIRQVRAKKWRDVAYVLACCLSATITCILALDTTRMVGLVMLIPSMNALIKQYSSYAFRTCVLLGVNIFVPSVYFYLHVDGLVVEDGVYKEMVSAIMQCYTKVLSLH